MESERKPIEQLVERVDELLTLLNYVAKDLREVSDRLKAAVQPQVEVASQPAVQELGIKEVISAFPEDLQGLLKFEDGGEFIAIRPVSFLGSDNFARIADIVRKRFNGDYISAGKGSYFRVPKKL